MRDTVTAMLFIIICLLTAALVFLVYKYKKMEKMADKTMAQMDDMLNRAQRLFSAQSQKGR